MLSRKEMGKNNAETKVGVIRKCLSHIYLVAPRSPSSSQAREARKEQGRTGAVGTERLSLSRSFNVMKPGWSVCQDRSGSKQETSRW